MKPGAIAFGLAAVSMVLLGAATYIGFGRLSSDPGTATAVERAAGVRQTVSEIDESVAGLRRRECMRNPTYPGCAELLGGSSGPARPRAAAPMRAVAAEDGASLGGPFAAHNLLRDDASLSVGWRSATARLPQDLTFELRQMVTVDRAAFRHLQASPPASWAREVELLLSDVAADAGFLSVGRWPLRQTTAPQEFSFQLTKARYARLRILSRHADAGYVALGEFALGVAGPDRSPLLPG